MIFDWNILLNEQGFLKDLNLWNEDLAKALAEIEGLTLTENHWKILSALREFYKQYALMPTMRAFLNYLHSQAGLPKMNSADLYALFPKGPILQGAKISGLPKPRHCI